MVTAKQMSDIREEFERVMTSPQLVVSRPDLLRGLNIDKLFVDEMSEFATPMHDDLVDAMNYAFKPPPKLFPKAWIDGVPVMYDPAVTEWPRHGFRWVEAEVQLLHKAFISGTPVENIAAVHKRSVSAVLAQLQSQRLIHHVEGQQVGDWHKRFGYIAQDENLARRCFKPSIKGESHGSRCQSSGIQSVHLRQRIERRFR